MSKVKITDKRADGYSEVLGKDIPDGQYFTGCIRAGYPVQTFVRSVRFIIPLLSPGFPYVADESRVVFYRPVDVEIVVTDPK